jgi:hypothetical protein
MKCGDCLKGAAGIAKAALGIDRPDDSTIAARRAICRGCEHAEPCPLNIGRKCRCALCGCVLRAKTAVASEACPAGKWPAVPLNVLSE